MNITESGCVPEITCLHKYRLSRNAELPTEIGEGVLWFSKNFYGFSMANKNSVLSGKSVRNPGIRNENLRMDAAKAALQGEFAATSFQSLRLKPSREMGNARFVWASILLMVQNPKANHRFDVRNSVNNGITYL